MPGNQTPYHRIDQSASIKTYPNNGAVVIQLANEELEVPELVAVLCHSLGHRISARPMEIRGAGKHTGPIPNQFINICYS
jgi:hypothetical protein